MSNCQIIGFDCPESDLCTRCHGDGEEPDKDLCMHCERCFDDKIGWSTGIEPKSSAQVAARIFCEARVR